MLAAADADRWLHEPVVVEEKLDGANVCLWWDAGPQVASRGGQGTMDRAGQLGRLRAWSAERAGALEVLLADGWALYGEWLWLRHGVAYDRLPDWLVALDLWHQDRGFASLPERGRRCEEAGLALPPRLFSGVLGSRETLFGLLGSSKAGTWPAEGLMLRAADGRRCKLVAREFARRTDEEWAGQQEHNALAPGQGTRHLSENRHHARS